MQHTHSPEIAHHVRQARSWLGESDDGRKTAALSYAALEARYAIERLALEYWVRLLNRQLTPAEAQLSMTYSKLQQRIYDLAGHQKEIDGTFAFMRAVFNVAKIPAKLPTPHLGNLAEAWHTCSEICHIGWAIGSGAPGVAEESFSVLTEICQLLDPLVDEEAAGWPIVQEANFAALRDRFIAGKATEADVKAHAEKNGLWARQYDASGRPVRFIGEAIPPLVAG